MKIVEDFRAHADTEKAKKQEAYLRDQFKFLGLPTPVRRELSKSFLKEKAQEKVIDWQLVDFLWSEEEREFQYLACDYLRKMKKYLEATDTELLSTVIRNNLGSKEFFINKAIGWALRDYSKTHPKWVAHFLSENEEKLANLSLREASKYL